MQIKDMIPWTRRDAASQSKEGDDHPLVSLQRDMNRVFDNFWNGFEQSFGGSGIERASSARCDVIETSEGIEVTAELPGMDRDDIEVQVSDDAITIKGEKKLEQKEDRKGYYMSERSYGSIYRSIPLPPGMDGDKAEASFKNGILTVKLPQSPEAKAKVRQIEVKGA